MVDEEEHVEPAEEHGVDAEEVAGDQALRLRGEELRPGWPRPPRRGLDVVALQDRPDARGGDRDPHRGELALDPPVTPGWVLFRQAEDERSGTCGDGRPAGPTMWVGPVLGDEVTMPAQQGIGLNEEASLAKRREQSPQAREHGPVGWLQRPTGTWRRSTATSWRSMTTSIARSVSATESRINWRRRTNARYRNERTIPGCSPDQDSSVKIQRRGCG